MFFGLSPRTRWAPNDRQNAQLTTVCSVSDVQPFGFMKRI